VRAARDVLATIRFGQFIIRTLVQMAAAQTEPSTSLALSAKDEQIVRAFCGWDESQQVIVPRPNAVQAQLVLKIAQRVSSNVQKDRIEFLRSRPWYRPIHGVIQKIIGSIAPGTHIVAAPADDEYFVPDMRRLLGADGMMWVPPTQESIKVVPGKVGECHHNCHRFFRKGIFKAVYSGWGLSEDGLWRYHSWGVDSSDVLCETSEKRVVYLGSLWLGPGSA
jgi:hypothetical protein